MGETTGDPVGPVWRTWLDGEEIELPASINGIRAALPPERREQFDEAVGAAAAGDLELLLGHWAQETRPDLRAAQEAVFRRLEAGDSTGFVAAEDLDA
ncbi:hypothetical protein [Streptomyces marincola]|uniref:hypothetical protein n=1 Tax=Streptomyces marincola TaxID=2878388 RepID=UPI001CF28569|nr:hypothetical protein [Streptomyces marincola]UCM88996.1 hypothetical protein LC193_14135 [Streptomyces marincola]